MRPRTGILLVSAVALLTGAVVLWPASESAADKKTILFTVWGMPFEDRLFLDRYAREWERLNPGLRVEYRRYGDDLLTKYNAWHTRGRGAEVMRLRVTDYNGMAARGMLEPLDGIAERAPVASTGPDSRDAGADLSAILADTPPHLRDLLKIDGLHDGNVEPHIYALPEDNAQFGLFYNKAIFDRYNAAHPETRVPYPSGEWTWDDLRTAAKKLTMHDGDSPDARITQAGFDVTVWSWPFMTLLAQAGGRLWSDDGLTCTVDSDAGAAALEFLRTMQREDRSFQPNLSGFQSGTGPDVLFAAGRTAMLMDGSWRVPNIESVAPGLDFAVAPLPRGTAAAVVSGCVMWGISSHARHKDEAWRFLRWLVQKEQALEYWDTLRVAPPASLSAVNSPQFRRAAGVANAGGGYEVPPMPEEQFTDRAEWLAYANTPDPATGKPPGFVPVGPYQTELEEEIQRMLNEYLNPGNQESARAVLRRVAEHMRSIIERDRAAKGLPMAAPR